MPLKSFVDEARKTNALIDKLKVEQKSSEENIIDISEGSSVPAEKLAEIKNTNKSSLPSSYKDRAIPQNRNLTDFEKSYMQRERDRSPINTNGTQKVDDRHNNIISKIITDSNTKRGGNTNWECCKYKKDSEGVVYCTEFHSLCGKEKCKRATD